MAKGKYSPKANDYVLGTTGSAKDPWCVGWFVAIRTDCSSVKYLIADVHGQLFRTSGYTHIRKISRRQGHYLIDHKEQIEESGKSLNTILRNIPKDYFHIVEWEEYARAEEE